MKAVKNFFRTFFIVIAVLAIAFAALVIYAVVTDSKLPEDLTSFSEESLERSIDDAWQSGEAELRLHYETGDMTLGELEQHVSDYLTLLSEQNPRYWYTVRNAGYSLVEYTDYFEAVLSFLYQEQPVSYDELPRAATTRDALALLAPSLRDGETVFTFLAENGWTSDDLNALTSELIANSVELAAESNTYQYYFVQGELDPYDYVHIELEYRVDPELLRARSLELRETLDALAAELAASGGDARSLYLAAARAVMDRAEYDDDARIASYTDDLSDEQKITRSAYGAVVSGHTVCTGYAMAYKALCDRLGLPCWVVSGFNGDGGHAWNMIELDGQTLYMDCTFADTARSEEYLFMDENKLAAEEYYYSVNQLCPWAA